MNYNGPPGIKNLQPFHYLIGYVQNKKPIQIWHKNLNIRLRGYIVGFDKKMNVILDEAEEIDMRTNNRKQLGKITLKGYIMANTKFPVNPKVHPIDLLRYLQNRSRVQIWVTLHEDIFVEAYIVGYDEYMNIILDETEMINRKNATRKKLGRIVIKGVHIKSIFEMNPDSSYCIPLPTVRSKL